MGKKPKAIEVAPVPGFFGHVVKSGCPLRWSNEVNDFCMQLNSAALGADATKGRSTLSVVAKSSKIALCTLMPEVTEQWNLTQTFTPIDGAIEFTVTGPNAIHLTGFIEVHDEEDSGNENDFDDLVADDEGDWSSDVDEDSKEEPNHEDRFEVLEERLNNEAESKKMLPEGEVKKSDEKVSKKRKKKENKNLIKAEVGDKDNVAADEAAKEILEKDASKKQIKIAKQAEKEKKIAEKIAEVTASHPQTKKRAAPTDSVEVPKKAKVTSRLHKGVMIQDAAVGKGRSIQRGRKVSILYVGRLKNGKQFDANQSRKKPFTFRHGIGDVIKGMDIGIEGMRVGSKRTINIPSHLGYGCEGMPPTIPGNADLVFEIEIVNA